MIKLNTQLNDKVVQNKKLMEQVDELKTKAQSAKTDLDASNFMIKHLRNEIGKLNIESNAKAKKISRLTNKLSMYSLAQQLKKSVG